jgi:glycine cleavage system aminomethyltransferase T
MSGSPGENLQQLIDRTPNLVDHFFNDTDFSHFSRASASKAAGFIPPAFTNWRDEQTAWDNTAVLLHQSHHMPELFVEGPDAFRLLEYLGVNTFSNFTADRGKQFVACTPAGHVIGDCIAYRLGEQSFELVSGVPVLDWIEYNAAAGNHDVRLTRDDATNINLTGQRVRYRFQLDGPHAAKIFGKVVDGGAPEIGFFRTARVSIRGHQALVLRHGMTGHQGVEISGPYADEGAVREAILQAGEEYGILPVGTTAYFSTNLSDAWIAYPVPGIFTGEDLRGFREWLPATGWEANTELGGSFYSPNIEDYYTTPYDLGYGSIVKFDHDFVGRSALERLPEDQHRTKVTLVWNKDDVQRVFASQFGAGPRYKSIELPVSYYAWHQFDEVRSRSGDLVGLSRHSGYLNPVGEALSLAMMNPGQAEYGSEVLITWGEPGGGSRKRQVERHEQTQIRATIAPAPYATRVQEQMRKAVRPM